MTRGRADVRIAVIHPIESYWLAYGPRDMTGAVREELESGFASLTSWLLLDTLDFDYICESTLPDQYRETDRGFAVGEMVYDAVVVPGCLTLRSSTLERLSAFVEAGGTVIFAGAPARYCDAVRSEAPARLAEKARQVEFSRSAILSALEPFRTLRVETPRGTPSTNLLSALRTDGDTKYLFLCHSMPTSRFHVDGAERYRIRIKGEWAPTLLDTASGEISPLFASYKDGETLIDWECYAQSSLLLSLKQGRSLLSAPAPALRPSGYTYLKAPAERILHEPNVCVLDMATWQVDGGEWQSREECLRIDLAAKRALGLSVGASRGAQPWVMEREAPSRPLTLSYTFTSAFACEDVSLALEDLSDTALWFNGAPVDATPTGTYVDSSISTVRLGTVRQGENTLVLTKPFGEVTAVESLYLLGDFDVEVTGDAVTLLPPRREVRFGDLTRQGLAFYGGPVTYRFTVEGEGHTALSLGIFSAPCVTASLDGKRVGNVSLAPYTADLGELHGTHTLEITVYISRVNTFGPLHLADRTVTWLGPSAWRSEGAAFSYEYRLTETGLLTAPRLLAYQNEQNS